MNPFQKVSFEEKKTVIKINGFAYKHIKVINHKKNMITIEIVTIQHFLEILKIRSHTVNCISFQNSPF